MCEARPQLHGDPEAMRRFGERHDPLTLPGEPPATACAGGMHECATFTAADVTATASITAFLAETADAMTRLRATAAAAAADYVATDETGARSMSAVVFGVVEG